MGLRTLGSNIAKLLFRVARSPLGGTFIGWSFAHATSLMPVDKLHETELVVAFRHPKPSYPTHVLIVPKRAISSFAQLTAVDMPVIMDAIAVAQRLVQELDLSQRGYRFLVNGGRYQDVQQIHFHLIGEICPKSKVTNLPVLTSTSRIVPKR